MEGMDNPLAINDSGQVVGSSPLDPILWTDGNVIDLNRFLDDRLVNQGWNLTKATDINDNGWIVGTAVNNQTNVNHAFLLTPRTGTRNLRYVISWLRRAWLYGTSSQGLK